MKFNKIDTIKPEELALWGVVGDFNLLVVLDNPQAIENVKIQGNKKLWWNSESELWEKWETLSDFTNYISKAKELYLIQEE